MLVIDLLGPNLEDLFDMCGRKFTIKTVCMAAKQMVRGLSTGKVCMPSCADSGVACRSLASSRFMKSLSYIATSSQTTSS